MLPVVTPDEMAAIDAAAPEPVGELIERAAGAVARTARRLLGGSYGRRVVVVAGKGNNGNDGRVAARRLREMGMVVTVVAPDVESLPAADLVIDAAYGTGVRGSYTPPTITGDPIVLAVDVPSGVSGLTGHAVGHPWAADHTVTFAALKPGLLVGSGRALAGEVELVDIGLDTSRARAHVVERADVAEWVPRRSRLAHKWWAATWIVAGSPRLLGAGHLAARAAQRGGASYVRLSSPGVADDPARPVEAVGEPLPAQAWAPLVAAGLDRFASLAVGPGLGTDPTTLSEVRDLLRSAALPVVVDGDGLTALGGAARAVLAARPPGAPLAVLTPHEGEFARLGGHLEEGPAGVDRFEAARTLATEVGAVVLLKGPTTLVAHPDGQVLVVTAGDERLATAGTGDVLTGLVAALLAAGADPFRAAAAAAWLHARSGDLAWRHGLVAGDLVDHLPGVFTELRSDA